MNASRKRSVTQVDEPSATPPRKQHPQKEEPIEDFADRMLVNIFRLTVDPSREVDSTSHGLTYLPNLAQELADEDAPLKLSIDRLEEAIMEGATAWPADKALFDYLLPCWKRTVRAIKLLRGPSPQKEEILKEARRLCFSNCIFAVTMPELFRYLLSSAVLGVLLTLLVIKAESQIPNMIHWSRTFCGKSSMITGCAWTSLAKRLLAWTRTTPSSRFSPRLWRTSVPSSPP